ncbi:hypothetical protein COU54_00365 [Candidatus Pacearchaeota archaeon CG10_big_fil_rev_8_21_14_0_10_31_24]|nr:MAG: hypothetical protein COU54_00365 [Candidatus Pacearchaeota archaeon CG10_big_fil_rev_8_21_14_0_10_31_24]
MVVKKKEKGKVKKEVKKKKIVKAEEGGMDLDDAFGDDEDVTYAESKPKKVKKKKEEDLDEDDSGNEVERGSSSVDFGEIKIKDSKPIAQLKRGDKIRIDGNECEVDEHSMLMDHGATKEMALDVFDKNDKDYQIRYFDDQVERTIEVYELREIMYIRKPVKKIEW